MSEYTDADWARVHALAPKLPCAQWVADLAELIGNVRVEERKALAARLEECLGLGIDLGAWRLSQVLEALKKGEAP